MKKVAFVGGSIVVVVLWAMLMGILLSSLCGCGIPEQGVSEREAIGMTNTTTERPQ